MFGKKRRKNTVIIFEHFTKKKNLFFLNDEIEIWILDIFTILDFFFIPTILLGFTQEQDTINVFCDLA